MTAETLLMKLLAIPEADRDLFQKTLKTCRPENLELALIQLSQDTEDATFDPLLERWAGRHFPETLGKFAVQN